MHSGASIITEYHEESRLSPTRSREEVYTQRLEARIRELRRLIKANKPVIEQLRAQRKFFKKVCEKQRQKIEGASIDLIKEEYQREIQSLQEDRLRLQDMIAVVHEESSRKVAEYIDAKAQLRDNQHFLAASLEDIERENLQYEGMVGLKNQHIDSLQEELEHTSSEIKNKESVERKYREAMRTIQELEAHKGCPQ